MPQARTGISDRNPVVTGQRQFEARPDGVAVDRRHHGNPRHLQVAEESLEFLGGLEGYGRIFQVEQVGQVPTLEKIFFGRGDNDSLQPVSLLLLLQVLDHGPKSSHQLMIQQVAVPPLHVEDKGDDVVGVFAVLDHGGEKKGER